MVIKHFVTQLGELPITSDEHGSEQGTKAGQRKRKRWEQIKDISAKEMRQTIGKLKLKKAHTN